MSDAAQFTDQRDRLWRTAYAITGLASDADDIVQDAFVRMQRAKPSLDRPVGPWLHRVVVNLGRDHLRRRKRQPYRGEWLPSAVTVGNGPPGTTVLPDNAPEAPDARLTRHESVHYAFVIAMEALTENQRLVLVLRDVLGCSARETATHLNLTETNVNVVLHRARHAVSHHIPAQAPAMDPDRLGAFLTALHAVDVDALRQLLQDDATHRTDAGGTYSAAHVVLHGPNRIARVLCHIAQRSQLLDLQIQPVGRLTGIALRTTSHIPNWPPQSLLLLEPSADGQRIERMYSLIHPTKLTG